MRTLSATLEAAQQETIRTPYVGRLHRHSRGYRGNPVLIIHGPLPQEVDIGADWYSRFFPRAAGVYTRPGELYLTAKILQEKGCFTMPDDARELIEGVYGDSSANKKPHPLRILDEKDYAESRGDRQFANQSSLEVTNGYLPITSEGLIGNWAPEERVMTRLNVDSTVIRLMILEGSQYRPLHGYGEDALEMSQVNIPESWINKAPFPDDVQDPALEAARMKMPDRGRWCVLLPVVPQKDGEYRVTVRKNNGPLQSLVYDSRIGARRVDEPGGEA